MWILPCKRAGMEDRARILTKVFLSGLIVIHCGATNCVESVQEKERRERPTNNIIPDLNRIQ